MCEPTTIGLIIAGVSAGAGLYTQQQQADAQTDYNKRQNLLLLQNRADNANQVNLEQQQQHDLASQKLNANDIAMREAQGTALAASDGVSGISVDALLGDIGRKGAVYNSSVEQNLKDGQMALQNQLTNVNNSAASGINSLKTPAPVDYLGTALKIGGMAYGSYTQNSVQGGGGVKTDLSGAGGNLTGYQDRHG